ncbi:MAG: DUF2470 domain-containing protein [Pseudomonadota bacterium]
MTTNSWSEEAAAREGRRLIHSASEAALGTLSEDGSPHVSHVACATLADGAPIILISDLALHTKNVDRDGRASLLFLAPPDGDDTNARSRISVDGHLRPVADHGVARSRFLRRQPQAAGYIDFKDFRLMRLVPERAHLVAGFGRITSVPPLALVDDGAESKTLEEIDAGACEHMDDDHADALAVMATALGGGPDGVWRAVGVDRYGIDLGLGPMVVRVEYPEPLSDGMGLRKALKYLADQARAAG